MKNEMAENLQSLGAHNTTRALSCTRSNS